MSKYYLKLVQIAYRFVHRIAHQKGGFKRYHMNTRKMKNPDNHTISRVLILPIWRFVGMTGFEPATTRPPAECATGLRYIPNSDCKNIKVE